MGSVATGVAEAGGISADVLAGMGDGGGMVPVGMMPGGAAVGQGLQVQAVVKRLDAKRWETCARLPVQLVVTVPLPSISLKELVALKMGQRMLSSWLTREDVPLMAGGVFLANVSFEPAGMHLAVRISGFQKKSASAVEATQQQVQRPMVIAADGPDEDHTLNDLRMAASLCFGAKTMLLHQVLDLTSGDAIVLERGLNAPVNVLTGRRIVAQGELIAVKGCYGVRLTKLAEAVKKLKDADAQI